MTQQVKLNLNLNLMPGLEISIDPDGLLFHLADQSSPQEVAFTLLKKYGVDPLLEALKQGFSALSTEQQEERVKEEVVFCLATQQEVEEFVSKPLTLMPIPNEAENTSDDPPEIPEDLRLNAEEIDEVDEFLSKPKPTRTKQTDKTPLITCSRPGCGKVFMPKKGQRYCDHRCSQKRWADKNREYTRQKGRERYHSQKQLSSQPEAIQEGE